ncbi:hypothetical protein Goarm_022595, partial [Gossypium armourianum]|nr:hypothetical protein [Gossypium armourianum]
METLQNLQEEDIEWRAPWMLLDEILYKCGDFDLVSFTWDLGSHWLCTVVGTETRQTRRMKRLAVGPSTTPEYIEWLSRRINDNIPVPRLGDNQLAEKHEKMNLKLDIDVQKLETEGLRKGKHKAKEDLNSLKTDYKRLRLSVRTARLGKTSEQWRQEVQEEKVKA